MSALDKMIAFEPTREREWTFWDKLVHALTGRVSYRVYDSRMEAMWRDDLRLRLLQVERERERAAERAALGETQPQQETEC